MARVKYHGGGLGGGREGNSGAVDTSGCDYYFRKRKATLFVYLQFCKLKTLCNDIIILLQNGTQFQTEYKNYVNMSQLNVTSNIYSQQCYDATWALAYALNDTLTGETQHHKIIHS